MDGKGWGVCGEGGMHSKRGHAWQRGAYSAGGMRGRRDGQCSGRYASYWNAFLLNVECDAGDGYSYVGRVSKTNTGLPCQAWSSQTPHTHSILDSHLPEQSLLTGENFCR